MTERPSERGKIRKTATDGRKVIQREEESLKKDERDGMKDREQVRGKTTE